MPQSGVAQRSHLHLSFSCIARWKARFRMAGVTVELGHALANLFVQEPEERVNADMIEISLAAPPTIELREIPNLGMTPHGHSNAPPPGEQGRKHSPRRVGRTGVLLRSGRRSLIYLPTPWEVRWTLP